jgi:hypothetical protein
MSKGLNKILKQAPGFGLSSGSELVDIFWNPGANVAKYGEDSQKTLDKQEAAQESLMSAASNRMTPKQIDDASAVARRDFYNKQALLSMRKSTTKTSSLGVPSDTLQTNRKSLLGAT